MKTQEKIIKVYVSDDGKEFESIKDCHYHENYLKLLPLHEKLVELKFYDRFKIVPYYHNFDVKVIRPKSKLMDGVYTSFVIVYGRMGNGDCRVRLKIRGENILLIRYNTDGESKPVYLGKIPLSWCDMDDQQLEKSVEEYLSNRRIFVKKTEFTTNISYVEI